MNLKLDLNIDLIDSQRLFNSYHIMCGLEFQCSPLDCTKRCNRFDWSRLPLKKRPIKENYAQEDLPYKYQCSECHKLFVNGVRYRAHLRRHESKRSGRYRCLNCLKTFVQRSSLTTHLRIHSGEKPFHCQHCHESFGDFSTFTKHKRIHSGEKPYACPLCQRTFSQSGNMHRHLKAVHRPDSPELKQIAVNAI